MVIEWWPGGWLLLFLKVVAGVLSQIVELRIKYLGV
jgi:hypothetical protein